MIPPYHGNANPSGQGQLMLASRAIGAAEAPAPRKNWPYHLVAACNMNQPRIHQRRSRFCLPCYRPKGTPQDNAEIGLAAARWSCRPQTPMCVSKEARYGYRYGEVFQFAKGLRFYSAERWRA